MMTLGLNGDERRAYEKALRRSHTRRIEVDVLNLNGVVESAIHPTLIGGQVNVDIDAEVTRSASLQFLDPRHTLNFDTDSPDSGALFADRMVRIRYGIDVEALGGYVWATIFTGPVTRLSRAGDVVNVEAQGKESLVRGAIWKPLTLRKGATFTDAIRTLMRSRGGETSFAMPEVVNKAGRPIRLPRSRSLDRYAEIWKTALSLARGVNRQLFYDGRGVLVLRSLPGSVVYTFTTAETDTSGTNGDVLTDPQISYELGDVKNVVEIKGQPPKGKKGKVRGVAIAPRTHALSPWRLGRSFTDSDGDAVAAPRYLVETIEDSSIRSDAAARRRARDLLEDRLREVVDVSFDSLPIPHLDPGDLVRIQTGDFTATFRLRTFSIPLTPEGAPAMPVGYVKRLTPNRKKIRA